ncbi:MAG: SdpI family protein [Actinomycetota bacterium]|nr:SdpI family protein [Actinomycetota bacterium]
MVSAKLLGSLLLLAGLSLLSVGLLGWRGVLRRNRVAGVRTPASLRSDAAFRIANRVAGPPVTAAGVVCIAGGALAYGATGTALTVIVGVTGAGTLLLVLAGGILGNRAAAELRPKRCGGCACGAGGCRATKAVHQV